MSSRYLIAICSRCERQTGDNSDPPICCRCRRNEKASLAGLRKKTKFVRQPEQTHDWEPGSLPCRRCGAVVVVPKGLELAAANQPVVVECDRPCVRSVVVASVEECED